MSTVTSKLGDVKMFVINTSHVYDYVKHEPVSYSNEVAKELFKATKDKAAAIKIESALSGVHEMTHILDKSTNENFTWSMIDGLRKDRTEGEMLHYLVENVSEYATAGPKEASAEVVSKYIHKKTVDNGGVLDKWAKKALKKR
jgi:hypothetical protein